MPCDLCHCAEKFITLKSMTQKQCYVKFNKDIS